MSLSSILEARFALSALPPHLRDGATTFTLDPAIGYAVGHKGANGFRCIVMRTEWSWLQLAFRDDIFVPLCYDAEGSKKMLPVWMDVAKQRAQGKKFANGTYQNRASRRRVEPIQCLNFAWTIRPRNPWCRVPGGSRWRRRIRCWRRNVLALNWRMRRS